MGFNTCPCCAFLCTFLPEICPANFSLCICARATCNAGNNFACGVNASILMTTADLLVSTGLAKVGYGEPLHWPVSHALHTK